MAAYCFTFLVPLRRGQETFPSSWQTDLLWACFSVPVSLFSCASKHDVSDWDVFNDRQSLASWKEVFWLCLDACVLGLRREVYGLLLSLGYKNRKNACPGWWWSHCCGPCSAEASPCGLNLTQEENTWVAGFN